MKPFYEPQKEEITLLVKNDSLYFKPHFHRYVEIVYLTKGKCSLTVDGTLQTLSAGEFFIAFPNQIHSYTDEDNQQSIVIIFPPEFVPRYKDKFNSSVPRCNIGKADEKLEQLFFFFRDEFKNASSELKAGYLHAIISKIFEKSGFLKTSEGKTHILRAVIKYCENNYKSDISLESTAKALNISKYYLSHIFSDKINMSFNNYVNLLRVGEAVHLLKETTLSVSEISEKCGFNSPKTFNRAFKKATSLSPREYRKL